MQVRSLKVQSQVEEWEVSHDGKSIVGIDAESITIWNLLDGSIRGKITKQSMIPSTFGSLGTWSAYFSPNSKLVTVSFTMLQTPQSKDCDYLVYSSHWVWDAVTAQVKYQFDSKVYERDLYLEDHVGEIVKHSNGVAICEQGKYFVSWGQLDDRSQHYDFWSLETGEHLFSQCHSFSEYVAVSSDGTLIWVGTDQEYYSFRVDPSIDPNSVNSHYISEYDIYDGSVLENGHDEDDTSCKFSIEIVDNLADISFSSLKTNKTHELKTNLSEVKALLVAESEVGVVGDERIELWSLESDELQGTYYITNKSQYKVKESVYGIVIEHPTQPPVAIMFDVKKSNK